MRGEAVQLLSVDNDSSHPSGRGRLLKLNSQVLRDIGRKADREGDALAVIAISGPEQQGKSFMLTTF